jgi:hypothetical protein
MSQPLWRKVFLESPLQNLVHCSSRLSLRPQSSLNCAVRRFFRIEMKLSTTDFPITSQLSIT